MNRRGFLKFLLPTAGALAVAPELLAEIWTPKRTIFLPPRAGWPSSVWACQQLNGGFMYSRELADKLKMDIQPLVRFRGEPGGLVVPEHLFG